MLMYQHPADIQNVSYVTGMLASRTPKGNQCVARQVMPLLGGNLPDGIGHVGIGYAPETFSHRHRGQLGTSGLGNVRCQAGKLLLHHTCIKRFPAAGAKYSGKAVRVKPPQDEIAVSDSEGATLAIAGWARVSPSGFWPDPEPATQQAQNRATTRCHCVYVHHGHPHANAGNLGVVGAFIFTGKMRHIG